MAQENTTSGKSRRGFASMDKERQRKIAQMGGLAVSSDREYMAEIGRRGGQHSHGRQNEENEVSGESQAGNANEGEAPGNQRAA
jgi:uncharacterized protein